MAAVFGSDQALGTHVTVLHEIAIWQPRSVILLKSVALGLSGIYILVETEEGIRNAENRILRTVGYGSAARRPLPLFCEGWSIL